ncbi:TspO/MBR family protein [Sphingomonas sp. BIUV-7]|uniref:TspO/MBR family protein n=1 Tax=Sphingomonas natans TaxID=3063330 RepID=A0ABT8Y5C5_9SPHN|nr:TspO/MBR family protein [Sphingomonas sp. BIUV-7]MDO6413514.1 TspO/MBR family protein [Sphingomonas sp. BIUV-7]
MRLRLPIVTALVVLLLGLASGWLSGSGAGNAWFDALAKPGFMPPGWAFPVAWTTLYLMIGTAFGLILETRHPLRSRAILLFVAQLLLNYAWSPVFFALHQPLRALAIIVLMVILTALTALDFHRIRPLAAWLLLPYLAWLIFAATLNGAIVALNPA